MSDLRSILDKINVNKADASHSLVHDYFDLLSLSEPDADKLTAMIERLGKSHDEVIADEQLLQTIEGHRQYVKENEGVSERAAEALETVKRVKIELDNTNAKLIAARSECFNLENLATDTSRRERELKMLALNNPAAMRAVESRHKKLSKRKN